MRMWPLELLAALWLGCAAGAEAQTVELGLDAAADHTVIYPLTTVPANIRQFVAIITYGAATPKKIHAEFVAIGAPAQIGIRATDHTVPKDEEKIVLRFALQGDLPVGRYELAVLFDGKRATSSPFEVTAPVPPLRVASPIAL